MTTQTMPGAVKLKEPPNHDGTIDYETIEVKAYDKASGTQAQVLALLNLTELQRFKPRLKERRLCPFFPFIYIPTQ